MTIPEFARLARRTPQAIYGRLKQESIKVSDLQEEDGKTLSQEGLSILASMFRVTQTEIELDKELFQANSKLEQNTAESDKEKLLMSQRIKELEQENSQLKTALAEIRAAAAVKEDLISALTARAEFAERISLQRLPGEVERKPSLWARITGRGKQNE